MSNKKKHNTQSVAAQYQASFLNTIRRCAISAEELLKTAEDEIEILGDNEGPTREVNVRKIGTMTRLSDEDTAALIKRMETRFGDYPADSAAYSLGDFRAVFPLDEAPYGLDTCPWAVVTDANTNEPLALIPDVLPGNMEELRRFFRLTGTPPIVFIKGETLYWDEPKHSFSTDSGWFPLTADNTNI